MYTYPLAGRAGKDYRPAANLLVCSLFLNIRSKTQLFKGIDMGSNVDRGGLMTCRATASFNHGVGELYP
jgi:hypothetical protein